MGLVWAYATDYAVEGTVQEKQCDLTKPVVDMKFKLGGMERSVEVTEQQCSILNPGNYVVYHVRSQRTTIYEKEGGSCLYDSTTGLRCGQGLVGF